MASGYITAWQIEGEKVEVVTDFLFLGSKITVGGYCSHEVRRQLLLGRKAMTNLDSVLKSRDILLIIQDYCLPSGQVWLWELDHKEGRMPKNWCPQTMVLEKTPKSPLGSKEVKSVNLKGDQLWLCTGSTEVEAEALVFWSSHANRRLIGKVPDVGKIEGRRRRGHQTMRWMDGITDAMNMNLGKLWEMVRDRVTWGLKEPDMTGWLNNKVCHYPSQYENRLPSRDWQIHTDSWIYTYNNFC